MVEPIKTSAFMPSPAADDVQVFDRILIKARRNRSAANFKDYDFLFQWTDQQLKSRLSDIKRDYASVLQIGARGSVFDNAVVMDIADGFSPSIIAEEEFLPIKDGSLDMVISTLALHSVNDLPGALMQIRKALKPDGLFIAALLGGETLHELRECLMQSEIALKDGASPRVSPFADKQQLGALLQRAGFALPVVDSEIVTVTYEHVFKLFGDLRGMGESNVIAARSKEYVGKTFFMETGKRYQETYAEADGRIPASFEVLFLIGWAPHDSQQQPLKPGSGKTRLAEALGSDEVEAGEKATP